MRFQSDSGSELSEKMEIEDSVSELSVSTRLCIGECEHKSRRAVDCRVTA